MYSYENAENATTSETFKACNQILLYNLIFHTENDDKIFRIIYTIAIRHEIRELKIKIKTTDKKFKILTEFITCLLAILCLEKFDSLQNKKLGKIYKNMLQFNLKKKVVSIANSKLSRVLRRNIEIVPFPI